QWDSVYYMLNCLCEIQPVVNYFLTLLENSDLAWYKISPQEWLVMQDIEVVLSVSSTQSATGESHLILSGSIPTFEQFMLKWETIMEDHPNLAWFIKTGLKWVYMYA
ncbi:hypothetical protein PILCRDRAFT_69331, partial [Piloderma croceum F 1598]